MTQRLDAALAARGLARSRTHAATLISQGLVTVDGRPVVKPAVQVGDDSVLEVAGGDHYVSRAAHKLIAGLDAFGVDVRGRLALDMGVKGGLVTNPVLRADAVAGVLWAAWDAGLGTCGIVSSPIAGTHGNSEYIAHLAPGRGSNPTEWLGTVNRLAGSR